MISQDVLFPPGATQRDWAQDAALAGAVSMASVLPALLYVWTGNLAVYLHLALSLAMTVPLVLRRHSPLLAFALCTAAGMAQMAFLQGPTPSLFAIPIVAYSVARWVPGHLARLVVYVGAVASVLGPWRWFSRTAYWNVTAYILFWGACLGAVLTPYAIGRRMRELYDARAQQVQAAVERYRLLLAEREQQNKLGEASVRAMIARELHDIVAHSLSVIIVQAEGGRAAASRKPEVAQEALDTIAETGREALHEMRRIVGVLRGGPDADEPQYSPAPTLRDIGELVARTSEHAEFEVRGEPGPASPALELTAYRVVQEALTNFLKHAGPDARAWVTVSHEPHRVVIDVTDDGAGSPDATDGRGNGLRGMQERVSSMGGMLRVGPRPDGPGFRVTAILPTRESGG